MSEEEKKGGKYEEPESKGMGDDLEDVSGGVGGSCTDGNYASSPCSQGATVSGNCTLGSKPAGSCFSGEGAYSYGGCQSGSSAGSGPCKTGSGAGTCETGSGGRQ